MERHYTYDLREFQLKCVETLEAIDKVCHEHGLKYYIIAGTLLGAVRHKGFIPWDDDIDIAFSREDYDTLVEHADEWLPSRFRVVTHQNDPNYPKYFAKIEDRSTTLVERFYLGYVGGVYLDIFALDRVPDNRLLRNLHFYRFHYIRKLLYFAYRDPYKHGKGFNSSLVIMLQKLLDRQKLHARAQKIITEYKGNENCHFLMTHDDGTCCYPIECVGEPKKYEFEGRMFDGPSDSTVFLSSYYGDTFMQLPPLDKRRSHYHDYCDINSSYIGADIEELKKKANEKSQVKDNA